MLRDVDPGARNYAAILIAVESYDDAEIWEDLRDRETDLNYLINRLRLSDLFEFSQSYRVGFRQWRSARGILLKGLVYKRDFEDLMRHPVDRYLAAELSHRDSHNW